MPKVLRWAQTRYRRHGHFDTAVGYEALKANTTGKYNVFLGWEAGLAVTTGSNNIDIGNPGLATDGVSADRGVIRIGTQSPTALQTSTSIAGIYDNTSVVGITVEIDSTDNWVPYLPPSVSRPTSSRWA